MRNRTADLLLTMETLCRLSYRGLNRVKHYTRFRVALKSAGGSPPGQPSTAPTGVISAKPSRWYRCTASPAVSSWTFSAMLSQPPA